MAKRNSQVIKNLFIYFLRSFCSEHKWDENLTKINNNNKFSLFNLKRKDEKIEKLDIVLNIYFMNRTMQKSYIINQKIILRKIL